MKEDFDFVIIYMLSTSYGTITLLHYIFWNILRLIISWITTCEQLGLLKQNVKNKKIQ